MQELFLDANAHVPVNTVALQKFIEFNNSVGAHGHPSALTLPARKAAQTLEESRIRIAKLIGADSEHQIIFTHGCSQACEWGIKILFEQYEGKNLYCSKLEHHAVNSAIGTYRNQYRVHVEELPCDVNGNFEIKNKHTISVHLQNEIGNIYNIKNIAFSDMSQSLGKISINVKDLNIDIAAFAGHKFGGLPGTGFLYLKNPDWWKAFATGSRYYKDITGTPSTSLIYGTSIALEEAIKTQEERYNNCKEFSKILEENLPELGFQIIRGNDYSHNTIFVKYNNALYLMTQLEKNRIYTGLGSACGSISTGSSKSIQSMGIKGTSQDFMRISQFGEYGKKEAKHLISTLKKLL